MAEDKDFNEVLDNIFLREESCHKASYDEGFKSGSATGNPEGYHLGYHRGAELGRELGYYLGIVTHYLKTNENSETKHSPKVISQLSKVKELIDSFPRTNSEEHDILNLAEVIRAQYKKTCALLKIPSGNPYDLKMESTVSQLRRQLDSITKYLSPLLPVANCHMVEFFTNNHWDNLLPNKLRDSLESLELQCILENFWNSAGYNSLGTTSALQDWISKAKAHCVTANNTYCITEEQFRDRIKEWGGDIKPGTYAKEFMTPKKRYEISTMAPLASAVCAARDVTLCIEAGGGRGPLLRALSAAHAQPALTLDCSPALLRAARGVEQKQSKSTKKPNNNGEGDMSENLHRYAHAYVTSHTNMAEIARDIFPELFIDGQDTKLLLTGLHTCGNLGPDSIRIFVDQSPVKGIFNVPCCYHLLTEEIDVDMFDVFQKNYSNNARIPTTGFPMSEHLRGYNLGRNARMLAAQSIDRVVSLRQLPAKSLLYRALLQVIIKDHVPNQPLSEGKLKRVSPKCGNFKQYFQRADEILNLNLFDRLTDSYLTDICHNIDSQWKKLVTFYLVRLCLAQVVESVILLDRLLFLFENGFYNVYLVKLFDPVLSPRCHSIVAIK